MQCLAELPYAGGSGLEEDSRVEGEGDSGEEVDGEVEG